MSEGVKLGRAIPQLVRAADLLAICALFGSQEVSLLMFIPLACMGILSYLTGFARGERTLRMINRMLFAVLTSVVIIALFMVVKTKLYPLIIATYTTMVVHGLMWFLPSTNRTRSVRMLVGLVEVAVAAVLTPEFYIALVIFCFVVVVAIEMSLMFLQDQLSRFDPDSLESPLPSGFIFHCISVSIVVFFLSLLIFPILPRARTSLGGAWVPDQKTRVGYTEQVNLGVLPSWTNTAAERSIALRIYLPPEVNGRLWKMRFPLGLLRSRVLDRFEGSRWSPDHRNGLELSPATETDPTNLDPVKLEVIREPIESSSLPSPYGAHSVVMGTGGRERTLHRSITGTWYVPGTDRARLQYHVTSVFGQRLRDRPSKVNLEVPMDWVGTSPRWLELRDRIFRGARSTREKMEAMDDFFKKQGFKAANENPLGDASALAAMPPMLRDPRRQLDVFLFTVKKGHCEYFASAAALLLRMAGVPTRLVAGFRLSSEPVGSVLTVRQGDGHAWLEVWTPDRGWLAFDPTPKVHRGSSRIWEMLAVSQELLSAYWYRYVLSFDQSEQVEKGVRSARSAWKDVRPATLMGTSWSGQQTADWLLPVVFLGMLGFFFMMLRFGVRFSFGRGWSLERRGARIPWTLYWRMMRAGLWFRSATGKNLQSPERLGLRPAAFVRWYSLADRLQYGPVPVGGAEWKEALREMDRLWPQVRKEIAPSRAA